MDRFKPGYDDGMHKGAPASGFSKAVQLRKNLTESEGLLWEKLKNHQFENIKFRRQHPIGIFIVDFYCHQYKLIIEIDGAYHNTAEQIRKDEERTQIVNEMQLTVLRFTNEDVESNIETVLSKIKEEIVRLKENTNLLPRP